jgi:spermidine/putrescine transport system permease protein
VTADRGAVALTVGPAALFLTVFLVVPLLVVAAYSVAPAPGAAEGAGPTLRHYRDLADPVYLPILWRSLRLAAVTTLLCLALGYPAAWAVSRMGRSRQLLPLLALVIPSWINLLIKNYAWIVLLRREGAINSLLLTLGIVERPLGLLFTEGAVLAGLVHSYLAFMVLPIYAALERIDRALIDAGRDLGASGWRLFRAVTLPQSVGGVVVGCVFVFVLALGSFVTPDLLGGARGMMIGNLIQNQILQVRNWPFGAALAVTLVAGVLGAVVLFVRVVGRVGGERAL